ncbi:MAG TPA: hypothetical protein DCP92_09535 [Nitrospiraceae bacterium]|jgi:hypothetical protein|nr:hypothetical protein [Nitrospiraceae bacterium]
MTSTTTFFFSRVDGYAIIPLMGSNKDKMAWWQYAVVAIVVIILILPLAYYFGQSKTVSGTVTVFYNA